MRVMVMSSSCRPERSPQLPPCRPLQAQEPPLFSNVATKPGMTCLRGMMATPRKLNRSLRHALLWGIGSSMQAFSSSWWIASRNRSQQQQHSSHGGLRWAVTPQNPRVGSEVHEVHGAQSSKSLQSVVAVAEHEEAKQMTSLSPDVLPPALKQRRHGAAEIYSFKRASSRAPTDSEFQARLILPGSCVMTRPALSSHWSKASPKLRQLDFWVWRVVKVYQPGEDLPGMGKAAD